MGRKPNALILQYFYRGAKLEDASNRYQHTCKACGEVFPKGRIDSLQNHITKKCTALDHPEKTKILLQFHNSPSSSSASKAEKKAKEHRTTNIPAQHLHTPQQAFDGLNVLAEASRQVGPVETRASHIQTYPPTSNDYHPATSGGGDPMNIAIDPSLDAFTNPFDDLGTLPHHHGHTNAIADLPSLAPLTADETDDDHMHEHNIGGGPGEGLDIHGSTQQDKDLSTIAADANELLPQHLPQHVGEGQQADEDKDLPDAAAAAGNGREIVDTDGRPNGVETEAALVPDRDVEIIGNENAQQNIGNNRSSDQWQLNLDGPNFQAFYEEMQKAENGQSQAQPLASVPRPIAIREHDNEGEFTEFRASPNQGRRQIARQRFTAERRREVQDVRKMGACLRCRMLRKPCSPESPCGTCRSVDSARVWKEPCMRVRIPDLFDLYTAGLHTSLAYRDTTLVKSQLQFEHSHGQIQVTHFDEPAIGISFKALEGRIDAAAVGVQLLASENVSLAAQDVRLIDGEGDDLVVKMSSYLQAFGRALQENEPSHFMRSTLAATSDMYEESKDGLLRDILELWTATHVLCDLEIQWKTFHASTITQETIAIDEASDPLSYALITSQLRALVEKRASQLSKKVLQEYERRLMHNKRGFDMFLAAIVLLNSVERTTWLFHTWENEAYASRWPLERQPQEYWSQGENFSTILHMVLKMRTVMPKTSTTPDTGILMPMELPNDNDNVMAWYGAVQLTEEHLIQRQAAMFDSSDSRSFDLKFVSKILLPQH